MKKFENKNIILKEIILLFLITAIPLIIISTISLFGSNYKLTKQTIKSYTDKSTNFVSALDSDLTRVKKSASQILSHSKYNSLSYTPQLMSAYEKVQAVRQLREYITSIKNGSNIINNIKIYNRPLLKAYNADGYEKGSYENITADLYQDILFQKNSSQSPFFFRKNRICLLLSDFQKSPSSIIEVEISLNTLKKEFVNASSYNNSFYIFGFQDNEFVMTNVKDNSLYDAILSKDYKEGFYTLKVKGAKYEVFRSSFTAFNAYYLEIIPDEVFLKPLWQSNINAFLFIIFMFFWILLYFIGVIKIIHRPLNKLIYSFQKVETGDLSIRINEKEKSEFNYLYQGFNRMADNLDNLINQVYNQKLLLQKAEFKQLQAQINPHFLYNSFFMLHRMIQSEMQEESVKMASELGLYFKYITRNKSEFVSLKDEYAHARIYSNIQALRFEGRIEVSFEELPADAAFIQVPRLILQPVIENAYNYGLENMVEGGLLKVSFTKGYQQLSIHVEDNGNSLSDDQLDSLRKSFNNPDTSLTTGEISALLNIHQRMQIFFKSQEPLLVERSALGGLKVILNIEIGEDNSNETTANC